VTVTAVTQTSISLYWSGSFDNVGVATYDVYRDGLKEGSTPLTNWTFGSLICGVTHTLSVDASDAAGNTSAPASLMVATAPCDVQTTGTSTGTSTATNTTDPVIAAAGDIACDPTGSNFNGGLGTSSECRQKATSDLLVDLSTQGNLQGVLTLGDNQYEDNAYTKYLQSFDPSWGRVKNMIRPGIGNHEYLTPAAAGYFQYFGAPAGDPSKGYYSFDKGSWHIIALNSNCSQVGGCGAGSPQEVWLRSDLAANAAPCTLAYWHHPRFSSGNQGNNTSLQAFWQALYNAHADVVLNGHDHDYERFALQSPTGAADPAGLREFVVGTGGKSHYGFVSIQPNSQVRNADTFGVLKMTLHSSSYDWRFVPEAGRTFTDSGSTACHGAPAPPTLKHMIESVPTSTAHHYTVRDSAGNSMDTLKIIGRSGGGYLGVYHTEINGVFVVKLATSQDLLNWTYKTDLAVHGSQPTLTHLSDGGYLLVYEADSNCTGLGSGGNCLRFLHYATQTALLTATPDRSYQAPRTLSKCAEGTPNIYNATLQPDIDHSTINIGFHYFRDCDVDRQASGVLTNFSSFSAAPNAELNSAIENFGVQGNIGDRDAITFEGETYNIHEGQYTKGDWSSWRVFLYDWATHAAQQLGVRTDRGSVSFANPTFSLVDSPNGEGRKALVVTLFLPLAGSGLNEAGELVYYTDLPS
jgi:hypothetical protein